MARGVSRQIRISREKAAAAWAAAAAAVAAVCGERPPEDPGVLRGGRRHDRAAVERRKLAIYTAVCGLGILPAHVAPHAGVGKQWITEEVLRELEDRRDDPDLDRLLDELTRHALAAVEAGEGRAAA